MTAEGELPGLSMELTIMLFVYGAGITILIGIIGIIANWFISKYFSRRMRTHPKDLAETFQKEIVEQGKCVSCGSDKVLFEPMVFIDDDGIPLYEMKDKAKCEKCGAEWESTPHFADQFK